MKPKVIYDTFLSEAQKNLESFNGDNKSKEYKKLQKELRRAENAFNSANEKYQIVESAIADLKDNNLEEYDALNDLKDAGGNAVDVYIITKDNLVNDKTGQKVDGITKANPNNAYMLIDNNTKEKN
ncbi:MAG: hypothetical protein IPK76_19395 [Lewinellaceae bacterium]|nr:hypothetical protein [Lewinellaceae bacterium]